MQLARIIGTATATVKHPSLAGARLLVGQPLMADRHDARRRPAAGDRHALGRRRRPRGDHQRRPDAPRHACRATPRPPAGARSAWSIPELPAHPWPLTDSPPHQRRSRGRPRHRGRGVARSMPGRRPTGGSAAPRGPRPLPAGSAGSPSATRRRLACRGASRLAARRGLAGDAREAAGGRPPGDDRGHGR